MIGCTNYFFIYRIDAAEQLYKAGKIEKILIGGDDHSLDGINEPECMRDSLVVRGVSESTIILDGKDVFRFNDYKNRQRITFKRNKIINFAKETKYGKT